MAITKVTGALVDIGDLDLTNVGTLHLDSIVSDASPAVITVGNGTNDTTTILGTTKIGTGFGQSPEVAGKLQIGFANSTSHTTGTATTATNSALVIGNYPGVEAANLQAGIQFNIHGGSQNRVAQISAVSEASDSNLTSLVFHTDEGSNRTEKMRLDSSGRLLIGTDSGDAFNADSMLRIGRTGDRAFLHFKTDADQESAILFGDVDDDVECAIEYEPANKALTFSTNNNTETMRMDSSGRVLIGSSTALSVTGGARQLQIEGTSGVTASMSIIRHSNSSGGSTISLSKSRATGDGGVTVVANNDVLGELRFTGADGSDHDGVAAVVKGEVDGTPGSNDMPGRLTFWTTADGAAAETKRMTITSGGLWFLGKTASSLANTGVEIHPSGIMYATSTDNPQCYLNRENSHGVQLQGRKDNSNVWSISSNANSLASDRNFKKDITDLQLGLDFVKELKPKTFRFKMDKETDPLMTGLIAQDLEQSLTDAGVEKNSMTLIQHEPQEDESESQYMVDYSKLIPVLIKGMQEQQTLIETLEAKVKALEEA